MLRALLQEIGLEVVIIRLQAISVGEGFRRTMAYWIELKQVSGG